MRIHSEEWSYNNIMNPFSEKKVSYTLQMKTENRFFCYLLEEDKLLRTYPGFQRLYNYFNMFKYFNLRFLGNETVKNHIQQLMYQDKIKFELIDNRSKLEKAFKHLCNGLVARIPQKVKINGELLVESKTLKFFNVTPEDYISSLTSTGYDFEVKEKNNSQIIFSFDKGISELPFLEFFYLKLDSGHLNSLVNFGDWRTPVTD